MAILQGRRIPFGLKSTTTTIGCSLVLIAVLHQSISTRAPFVSALLTVADSRHSSVHRTLTTSSSSSSPSSNITPCKDFNPMGSRSRSSLQSTPNEENEGNKEEPSSTTYNPFRLAVLKLGLTEPAWISPLNYEKRAGSYRCANCAAQLFSSEGKYDSGSGWPSFYKTQAGDRVAFKKEWDGRLECRCRECGGHLGHTFMDGPKKYDLTEDDLSDIPATDPTPRTGGPGARLPRFCINGASLRFTPVEEDS